MQHNERLSGKPNLQSSELENKDRQLIIEPGKYSSDESLQSNGQEGK